MGYEVNWLMLVDQVPSSLERIEAGPFAPWTHACAPPWGPGNWVMLHVHP